jgi:hypothetical protein
MSLQEKIAQAVRLANEFKTLFRFQHNGIYSYAYPGDTCNIVENRWDGENWAKATEHLT